MKDFIGNEVTVGDKVVFIEPDYHNLTFGTVCKINPKSVTVEYNHRGRKEKTARFEFIKVNED